MIERLEGYPDNICAFVCHGRVTREDYKDVLVPAVEAAFKKHDKLRLYYETAPDFTGIDPSAVWQDTAVGLSHFFSWEKIAVVTNVEWIKSTFQFFTFVMPAPMRVFPDVEAEEARKWITAD
ncbi:MAG: STAS/SEC14 domain-containing protein [Hyphomicrobiaceae bacterium]